MFDEVASERATHYGRVGERHVQVAVRRTLRIRVRPVVEEGRATQGAHLFNENIVEVGVYAPILAQHDESHQVCVIEPAKGLAAYPNDADRPCRFWCAKPQLETNQGPNFESTRK